MSRHFIAKAAIASLIVASASPALAGGLLGDIVNVVLPGAGDKLDEASDGIKKTLPLYGQAEEAISGSVRHVGNEIAGEAGGETLAQWIWSSKSDAVAGGVAPIPPFIRAELEGYFPAELLDSVRFRVGWGNELALPRSAFHAGAVAITLDDVIVFRADSNGHFDPKLWAHELGHVEQYRRWGVREFAKQYMKNHRDVEAEAERRANDWEGFRMARSRPAPPPFGWQQPMPPIRLGNVCYTPFGAFGPGQPLPVGSPCSVPTPGGLVWGQIG